MSKFRFSRLSMLVACAILAASRPSLAQAPASAPAAAPAPAAAAAQPGRPPAPDAAILREAMRPFLPAVGKWRGEGWMQTGPGEPQRAVSEETVEMRLDGLVLVVEGLHHAKLADGSAGKVVHHALAIASADPAGGYRFSTFLADGRAADARGNWENGRFVWAPPAPPGRQIRYVIDWTVADRWSEIGEMSTDGTTWTKFFEMNLTRVAQ